MPAGKLCRGGSINPEIKGCILYLDQSDPDQSYPLHWVYLVQEWFNPQKPPLTAGCSHESVLLIIWDHGSLCLPISTFQNDLYKTMISKNVALLLSHIHCKAFKSSPTFILTNWTPYNSLQPRHRSKDLDHTRVCWETTPVASELSCAHWAKRSLRTVACHRLSEDESVEVDVIQHQK